MVFVPGPNGDRGLYLNARHRMEELGMLGIRF